MKNFNIIFLLFILFVFSCNAIKVEPVEDNPKTLILGHRAAGSIWYGSELIGNSFEVVKYGYTNLDGIEVDLQMSKDSTIWLIHDNEIVNCTNDTIPVCFLTDIEIGEIDKCTEGSLITLEELFDYLSKSENKKFVSLDMKVVTNNYCFDNSSVDPWIELIADKVINLRDRYNPNCILAVECWDIRFLELIEDKKSDIETYLLVWNTLKQEDLDNASSKGVNGLSCNFDSEISKNMIDQAGKLNLKIQVWTPNSEDDIKSALFLNPFAIQTDNVKYFVFNEE